MSASARADGHCDDCGEIIDPRLPPEPCPGPTPED